VTSSVPIAIVGMACRFPDASGLPDYWRLLCGGVDAVREVPGDRWNAEELYDPDHTAPGRMNTRWGGFLDDVGKFDADAFGISSREVARMDPQQRITLEVAWEALEDAGIPTASIAGTGTGVFMGVSTYDHGAAMHATAGEAEPYDGTGGALSIVANRLSYCLNLRGPSVAIDTACSSSLVATHLACQALRNGEANVAIAGGVNVITSPMIAFSFSKGGLMAGDGRCKSFDHRADGYVRSEGAGVVVLKPLPQAVADGDRVYATVLGSAVNQDGRTNGLAAPNRPAQEAVLRAAYRAADVTPAEVDYVEAHGTGTAVGDPIEVGALGTILGGGRESDHPLRIGSVKSNLGHLEAAAGVAGLIKAALALHHRHLPPSIHYERPNPMLGLDRLPIVVQSRGESWPDRDATAVAGVSSFGFGGTNSHLVLSAAPAPAEAAPTESPFLVPLSARSEQALTRRASAWSDAAFAHLDDPDWLGRAAVASALRVDHHRYRAAIVAADGKEFTAAARALADGAAVAELSGPRHTPRRAPRPVLVFPGQGAQWVGMGRQLAASVPVFRDAIVRCDAAIARHLGTSLWTDGGLVAEGTDQVQPALFMIQVALAATWREWGLEPAAVVGHSMGEIAAAHVAGALSLDDAAQLVCERSRLLTEISGDGGLALVELDPDDVREVIQGREDELSVAAVNGPRATVISGTERALDAVLAELERRSVFARRVAVEFAAHSPMVEPLQPLLHAALDGIEAREAPVPLYSTVTGEPIGGRELGRDYWVRNVRQPVLFAPALQRALADGHNAFIEVAPHPVLVRSIAGIVAESQRSATTVSSLRRDEDEYHGMLRSLGELYTAGARINWRALHREDPGHLDLPPHGWEHRDFPVAKLAHRATSRPAAEPVAERSGELLGRRIRLGAVPDLRAWTLPFELDSMPELADHVVDDMPIVPTTYWLSAVAEAVGGPAVRLADVVLARSRPLLGFDAELQLALQPTGEGERRFTITSCPPDGEPIAHVEGEVRTPGETPEPWSPEEVALRCTTELSVDEHYERLANAGLRYGPRFRALAELRSGERVALARVRLPEDVALGSEPAHPVLLDACLQTVGAAAGGVDRRGALPLPMGVASLWVRRDSAPRREAWCSARLVRMQGRELVADVSIVDETDAPLWVASGLRVRLVAPRRPVEEGRLYEVRWRPEEQGANVAEPGQWLVLADASGVGKVVASRLTAAGERCRVVGSDVESALEKPGLRGVIDARAADPQADVPDLTDVTVRAAELARLLSRRPEPPRLWILTAGTQSVGDVSRSATLAGATLWGLGRVVANEVAELGCSVVDLPSTATDQDLDALTGVLRSADPPGQLAIREGSAVTPVLAPAARNSAGPVPELRPDRTYLVTGGLGALGLRVADWLVQRGARHLLLLGRRAPSDEAERELARLRDLGANVHIGRADLADAAELESALATVPHPLGGVLHLAGVLEDALLAEVGSAGLSRALAGKAVGAWNLHALTRDQPVELFVLFSSLAGLLGSPGQAPYAAANSFLDSLAQYRASLGLAGTSVSWGPWAGASLASGGLARLAARGVPPLDPEAGLDLLDEAVAGGRTHVAAAAFESAELKRVGSMPAARQLLSELLPAAADVERGAVRDEVLALGSAADRSRALRRFVVDQVAEVLGAAASAVDSAVPFEDLGFDSMMAIELRDRLEVALGVRLSATVVYAHPTAESLADGLLDQLAPAEPPVEPQPAEAAGEPDADLSDLDEDQLADLLTAELHAVKETVDDER
jgi:acyl transferase domain-containing protein/acyl carrier protein